MRASGPSTAGLGTDGSYSANGLTTYLDPAVVRGDGADLELLAHGRLLHRGHHQHQQHDRDKPRGPVLADQPDKLGLRQRVLLL